MKSEKVRLILGTETSGLDVQQAASLAEQVFRAIRDAIFAGQYQPGESLREMHLAKILAVSQATIREALVQLEQAGLVMRVKNRSTTISSFSKQEVRERQKMRLALEEMAALEAAPLLDGNDYEKLDLLAQAIQHAIEQNDYYECLQAEIRFHRFIWDRSGNAVLAKALLQLTTPLFAFLGMMHQCGLMDLKTTKPHDRIVEALQSKDSGRIRDEIRFHLSGSCQEYLDSPVPKLRDLLLVTAAPTRAMAAAASA